MKQSRKSKVQMPVGDRHSEFLSQLNERLAESDADKVSDIEWVESFIAHPLKPNTNWSFSGHEFQREIVSSRAPLQSMIKCSQIGASEISAVKTLMLVARTPKIRAIYSMPTRSMIQMFAADRINSIIENSNYLAKMVDDTLNNLSVKKFNNGSYLYMTGVESEKGAISIPAPILVKDEIDFCNEKILSRLSSRQAHWKAHEVMDIAFSTPTTPERGVSERYNKSSRGVYGVYHSECRKVVTPLFFEDIVVPGYERPLIEWAKSDLYSPENKVEEAFIRCPSCGKKISDEDMTKRREWVHRNKDMVGKHDGWKIQPFDVYDINPPARILRQIDDYSTKQEWVNFRVGEPYIDASSTLSAPIPTHSIPLDKGEYFLGCDVGKTSWIVIGKLIDNIVTIVHKESVINTVTELGRNTVIARVKELKALYKIKRAVVDSMPDLTLSASVKYLFNEGFIARYVQKPPELGSFYLFKDSGEVLIHRTELFNNLALMLSVGNIFDLEDKHTDMFNRHLKAMSKVYEDGVARWVNSGEDHYAHALGYMITATEVMAVARGNKKRVSPIINSISQVAMRGSISKLGFIP